MLRAESLSAATVFTCFFRASSELFRCSSHIIEQTFDSQGGFAAKAPPRGSAGTPSRAPRNNDDLLELGVRDDERRPDHHEVAVDAVCSSGRIFPTSGESEGRHPGRGRFTTRR